MVLIFAVLMLLAACGLDREENGATDPGEKTAARTASAVGALSDRPNVILVLADDLDKGVFERSTLDEAWVPEGASFENAVATTSLCCPSRASILRGQYAHNTGLWNDDNSEPGGGEAFFREQGLDQRTLATILRESGYKTWYGGKYLNGYDGTSYVPPGWDQWAAYLSAGINVNGRTVHYMCHYTDCLSEMAAEFIEERAENDQPFFMHVSALDTHQPLRIPPRHEDAYPRAQAPEPPSYSEKDVSDKPRWVRDQKAPAPRESPAQDRLHTARMRSALTLEDLSRNIFDALKWSGHLDDTYVIFTSDNGFHIGLHGVRETKSTPYMEAHEVPFVVRGPQVPAGASFKELVGNIDVAPTVLALAGVRAPGWMDGRSLASFLDGEAPEEWRGSLLIEGARNRSSNRPAYSGARREDEVYIHYESGEEEYYDLQEDPYQLESKPRDAPSSIKTDLKALERCAGDGCREAEGP